MHTIRRGTKKFERVLDTAYNVDVHCEDTYFAAKRQYRWAIEK